MKKQIHGLCQKLESAGRQMAVLEKAAGDLRRELLGIQHQQDIDAVKYKAAPVFDENRHQRFQKAQGPIEIIKSPPVLPRFAAAEPSQPPTKKTPDTQPPIPVDDGLSPQQCEKLIALLDPGPKGHLDIFYVIGNQKSEKAARKIEKIFSADGWKTNGVSRSIFSSPPRGILMVVNSKETAPSYASFIERVFINAGIPVSANMDSKYREWSLSVIVGTLD